MTSTRLSLTEANQKFESKSQQPARFPVRSFLLSLTEANQKFESKSQQDTIIAQQCGSCR